MIEQETKTSTKSRIVTWIIAVVMIGGIFSSFIVLIISSNNQQKDSKTFEEAQARLTEIDEEYQTTVTKLSNEHYSTFSKYSSQVKAYNAAAVTSLVKEDLVIGTGEEITSNTPYNAYYIGWLADGTVFDSSINGETLKDPISGGNLIQGWNEGVIGMKIGGVRVITMPPEMGYGDQVSGQIPANPRAAALCRPLGHPQVAR